MQTLTLILSGVAAAGSVGTVLVMLQVRKDVLAMKADVDREVADIKKKSNKAIAGMQAAIGALEM